MTNTKRELRFGAGKGAIFPHQKAGMLLFPLRRFLHSAPQLADAMQLPPTARVLELGPGPGWFSCEVAKRVPEGKLVLLDIQPEMLAMATGRLERAGQANWGAVAGDGMDLPFRTSSFDAALLVAVLGEIPDPVPCLREVRRVLTPGGLLCVSETRGDPDRIPVSRLVGIAEEAGFAAEQVPRGWGWVETSLFRAPPG
jgi:ubiquinone/menaquinone biosynthesis C-methylase UbiE